MGGTRVPPAHLSRFTGWSTVMRVLRYAGSGNVYTSCAYLVLGDWNRLEDVNTLIDPGADPELLDFLDRASTGVGKRRVEQVVLTHRHYDHVLMLDEVIRRWSPEVLALDASGGGVSHPLRDGDRIRAGDRELTVFHVPGHTEDSICLYAEEEQALFVGDSPVVFVAADASCEPGFVDAIERLARLRVKVIYFGHGAPLSERCEERIRESCRRAIANRVGGTSERREWSGATGT